MKVFETVVVKGEKKLGFHRISGQLQVDATNKTIRCALLSWETKDQAAAGARPSSMAGVNMSDVEIANVITQVEDYVSKNIEAIINPAPRLG